MHIPTQLTIRGEQALKVHKEANFSDLLEEGFIFVVLTQSEVEGGDHCSELDRSE